MALAAAGLTVVAAGGAFVGLRSDGGSAARVRHRQFAGSVETPDGTGATADSGSTVPDGAPDSTAPGAAGAGAAVGRPGPTASGGTTGGPTSTAGDSRTGEAESTSPSAGHPTTSATRPSGAGRGSAPSSPATAAARWGLLPQAPIGGRSGHTAVWTGREMVIWGGASDFDSDPLTDGAAFDPAGHTWRKLPAAPLSPRFDAQAVWTGGEMIVFGGSSIDGEILADGAAWDAAANRWRALPASPLGARDGAVVAWAGDRLVVWGGATAPPDDAPDTASSGDTPEPPGDEMKNDGAAYVPATDSWVPVPAAPIPARSDADSAWTGTRLIVSGGYHEGDDDDRTDGAALDPVSGSWSPIATRPSPGSCGGGSDCAGIWTGTVALFPVSGVAYDPAGDRWSAMAPAPTPDGPAPGEPAVWTGRRFMTWGISGADADDASGDSGDAAAGGGDGPPPTHGAMYDPAANRWQPFVAGPLSSRVSHTAVWTGQEMLIWGGTSGETPLADGAAYRPE
jgi:hypothetical protein